MISPQATPRFFFFGFRTGAVRDSAAVILLEWHGLLVAWNTFNAWLTYATNVYATKVCAYICSQFYILYLCRYLDTGMINYVLICMFYTNTQNNQMKYILCDFLHQQHPSIQLFWEGPWILKIFLVPSHASSSRAPVLRAVVPESAPAPYLAACKLIVTSSWFCSWHVLWYHTTNIILFLYHCHFGSTCSIIASMGSVYRKPSKKPFHHCASQAPDASPATLGLAAT